MVGHVQPVEIAEVVEVEAEGAILAQVEEVVQDELLVDGLAVGGQAHQLVFAGVDLEAGEVGEGRIEEAEGVGEAKLLEDLDPVVPADADGAGGPFAHAVEGEDGGGGEGRGEEGAGRVGLVVLGEVDAVADPDAQFVEVLLDLHRDPQFLAQPQRHGHHEGFEALGRGAEIGLQDAPELEGGLVVERHGVDGVPGGEPGLGEAVADGVDGEAGVVLLAREAFLLGGGDDLAVAHEAGGGVVVVGADSEDVHQYCLW